ncbi:MAG: TonB-dependent receptor [Bacteroidales bacterium]|nr:TonB-dependent receptor [Candidatus Sodaliphilus limicaballi]
MKQETFKIPARLLALVMGLLLSIGAYAQITVNGVVKDNTGEPVIGASVRVVGTQTGTVTDFDGNFTLNNVKQGAKLQITSIGYQAQEVAAAPQLEIVMADDAQVLDNLVVIGYGVVKKSDLTGSVTALKPDTKNKGVTVSAQDMLAGKVAGMSVTSGGGTPGGAATIRIRGGSSLNASNDPLIVVDGVPLDNGGVKGFPNGLAMINPNDIESFNVLKDASAAAIYGSRGSNGVIIITTKKGKRGQKPSVSYNGSFTVNTNKKTLELMDGDQYRAFVKELYKGHAKEEEALAALGTANTDWQDQIYRTALSHDHNITVAGSAGQILPYRLSLGYTGQDGILKTSEFKRYTVAANLNPSLLNDHLTMNLNAKYMYGKNRYADGGAIGNAVRMDPTQPVKAPGFENFGGYYEWLAGNSAMGDANWPTITNTNAPRNPVAILDLKNDRANSHSFTGSADIDYKIHGFEDLRLHLTLGGDFSGGKQTTTVDPASPNACYWGSTGWSNQVKENLTLSTYAQYYKDFTENHHFDIMGGYEWQHFWRKENSEYSNFYPMNSALTETDEKGNVKPLAGQLHTLTLQNNGLGYRTESYLVSFFGRLNYSYASKYFLTFTMRADGSSKFNWLPGAPNTQWGYFPSTALAWNIKKEDFLKDTEALSDLKLRLGWGKTGQQEGISDYGYYANYSMSTGVVGSFYDVAGDGTLARPNAYNPSLKWETTTTTNVGFDYGFMNNRITGTIDWYYKKTTDLINYAAVAAMSNFRNQVNQNIGSLKNTGIEFTINYKAIQTDDISLNLGYNFTYNKNEITELIDNDPDYFVPTGGISSGTGVNCQAHAVGHPASSFYVFQQVYDENGMPIEGMFVDRNADGVISDKDKYFYKSPMAPVSMGFNARLDYKNWDFGFNMRANLGNYVFNDTECGFRNVGPASILESVSGNYLNNRLSSAINYGWQTYDTYSTLSDRWVQNGSFLKMDNITLGYSFNNLFKGNSYEGVGGRVYATVNNVFCITKYKGIDPEVFGGIDNNLYPRPFSFIVGLSLNF